MKSFQFSSINLGIIISREDQGVVLKREILPKNISSWNERSLNGKAPQNNINFLELEIFIYSKSIH